MMVDSLLPNELDESELLRFIYTCPLGLLLLDRHGEIRMLNGAATALLVPYCTDGFIDNLFTFVADWDEGAAIALRNVASSSRAQSTVQRIRLSLDDKNSRWYELAAITFNGGLSVTCRDVTESVQSEEILHIARKEAELRGRADMAAGILHDMGNVLTGIGGQVIAMRRMLDSERAIHGLGRLAELFERNIDGLDGLLGSGKGKKTVDLLHTLHGAISRRHGEMLRIADALASYIGHAQELVAINRSYAAQGAVPIADQLKQLILDLHDMNAHAFAKRKGSMVIEIPTTLPRINADRSKVIQILLNMLKNAQEAWDAWDTADAGLSQTPPRLLVTLSVQITDDSQLCITVRDNGCGFEPGRAESFFRRGASTKRRGSGLGLYTSRKLAESLGGSMTLHSDGLGKGAVATLYLPLDTVVHETDQ